MRKLLLILLIAGVPSLLIAQQRKGLARLLPNHAKLQFAGSIGFVSGGFGYESPNEKFQGDFYYGFVPKGVGGVEIHSLTSKLTFMAISRRYSHKIKIDWLTTGVLVNYAYGKQYFIFNPSRYSYKYYGFPTQIHAGIFVGSAITKSKLGLYYEIGSTAKDMLSYVKNVKSLSFFDIVNVGVGTRFKF